MADELNPVQQQAQTPDAGGTNSGTPAPQQPPAQPPVQQPPQDDPNNPPWLKGRLEQAQRSAVGDLLKELGVTSAEDIKKSLKRIADIEAANQTEAEKLTGLLEAERKAREAAEQRTQQLEDQQRQTAIEGAIRTAATAARAEAPDDVIMRARDAHGKDVEALFKDGKVDEAGVKALIDTIKVERPKWFIGTGPGSPSNNNGHAPEPDADAKAQARRDAERRARNAF